jgi:transposase
MSCHQPLGQYLGYPTSLPNYSYIEACRSLGIGESAVRRWVDQIQKKHKGVTPQSKALTPEQ